MRPLLVLLCAGPGAGDEAIRAATAIELVHMATLVHDDVLDAAPLRRGLPTVVASSGRDRAVAAGDLLFSRAFADARRRRRRPRASADRQVELLAHASVALARGELAQRHDAYDTGVSIERYQQRCELKTAALFECACVIGAVAARRRGGGAARLRPRDRPRLPAARRRPRRPRPARAHRQGPRHRPARRHRDPAVHPRPRPRSRRCSSSTCARSTPADAEAVCDRIAATGAPEEVRAEARERVDEAKRELRGSGIGGDELKMLELVADGVVERYS